MKISNLYVISVISLLTLSGCGGGGGGETVTTQNSAVSQNTTTNYTGVASNTTNATFNANGSVSGMSALDTSNTTVAVVRNSSNAIIELKLTNAAGTTTFSTANGDTITEQAFNEGTVTSAYNASLSRQLLVVNDSYVAVGTWYEKTGNTGYVTVAHTGTKTTVDPSTIVANANYSGLLTGMLAENNFTAIYTISSVNAVADFNAKTLALTSSGTKGVQTDGTYLGNYAGQDFSVTLSDANSDNLYTGVATDSEGKTGNVEAMLYGANAERVAGIGTLSNGAGTRKHTFSYGAER